LQIVEWERAQAIDGECAGLAQVAQGALDGLPGSVLGKVSAQNDFKRSLRRPPVLGAISGGELIVHLAQPFSGRGWAAGAQGKDSGDCN